MIEIKKCFIYSALADQMTVTNYTKMNSMLSNCKAHGRLTECWNSNIEQHGTKSDSSEFMTNIGHFMCDSWHRYTRTCAHARAHKQNPPGRRADARCRSNATLPVQNQVFWPCTSVCLGCCHWHQHSTASLTSGPSFCLEYLQSSIYCIYLDIPLTLIVQFFAPHLEGLMLCLLSREHTAMFLPLQTPLDQTHGDWLSIGFLIYRPLYKKGLGMQHCLSYNIESELPNMEM